MKKIIKKNIFCGLSFFVLSSFFSFMNAQVGINTEVPATTLDVNGEVTVRETSHLSKDPQALYIDSNGKVGLRPDGKTLTTTVFYASTTDLLLKDLGSVFNSGAVIEFPFAANHIIYNTVGIENVGNYFKIAEDGVYQINGFVNFYIDTALGNYTFLVARMELSADNGQTWNAITGSRPVFRQTLDEYQSHSHIIPSTIVYITSGSWFRISFYRSFAGSVTSPLFQGGDVKDIQITSDLSLSTRTYQLVIKKL